jgi:hypothetical protein
MSTFLKSFKTKSVRKDQKKYKSKSLLSYTLPKVYPMPLKLKLE